MPQQYVLTFKDKASYEKYKNEVKQSGGTISNDYGSLILGFSAVIPDKLVSSIQASLTDSSGINTFELDTVVKTQS